MLASDPEPILPGLSPDDVLTVYFTRPTNRPDVSTTARLHLLFAFTPPLASQARAAWQSGDDGVPGASESLVITLAGTLNPNISATLVPAIRVSVLPGGGLRDVDNTCQNVSVPSLGVGGTWGAASQPQFQSVSPVVALDYGGQAGMSANVHVDVRVQWRLTPQLPLRC